MTKTPKSSVCHHLDVEEQSSEVTTRHDVVLAGGRVIDPESGFDGIANLGITGRRISAVTPESLTGRRYLDVSGLIVAPGWIDLHSHSHTVVGHRLQACDGVTTALDLEAGVTPVADAYAEAAYTGRPLNYGFSASWAQARMIAVAGIPPGGGFDAELRHIGRPEWQTEASAEQFAQVRELLARDVADGALGIGVTIGYAPRVDPAEYLAVAALAAQLGVPVFSHVRDLVEHAPDVPIDGAEELVRAAGMTGAHMHYCHINSTSLREIDRVLSLVDRVRSEGGRVSTEAYPYGAGMTGIDSAFLRPERLALRGITPQSIIYARTREQVADEARLREIQSSDPGGLAIIRYLDDDNPADRKFVDRALLSTDTAIASDAVPLTWSDGRVDTLAWPPDRTAFTHPRTAGTFSKVFRRYVRELGALTLMEVIRRASLLPAQVLGSAVPMLRRKGRLQPGCDADLVVFDADRVTDRATYGDSTLPSAGYAYVLVGGQPVIAEGQLDVTAMPGRPVRR